MSEIEKAIECMATNLIGDVQNGNEVATRYYNALDVAIQALQEKAERESGCEYCNDINCDEKLYLSYAGDMFSVFRINNCPMCGRKLVEE